MTGRVTFKGLRRPRHRATSTTTAVWVDMREPGHLATLTPAEVRRAANDLQARLTNHRQTLHANPELSNSEHRTAAYIEGVLDAMEVEHHRVLQTGIVATIPGTDTQRGAIGLRADMDALPITEADGREGYRSRNEGVMHACGHDGHVAVQLGVAELLSTLARPARPVRLYFQPAEEREGGAKPMVQAGALDGADHDAILALHCASHVPAGSIAYRHGAVTASVDEIAITIHGAGGHAAHPETAIDPIPVAANLIMTAQQILTREIDPLQTAVLTFGSIHGGSRPNVIADEVRLELTMRALEQTTREFLLKRINEVAEAVAHTHRATATVEVNNGYPVGNNDPAPTTLLATAATEVLGAERVLVEPHPSTGSEDFFHFGDTGVDVCMFRLGVGNAAEGITAPLHSRHFDIDESALAVGVAVMVNAIRVSQSL